ncbi:MAG: ABC transporter ATP-binding protein/permease [Clostridia bacterium]|nr:ABC transporter ATP-binding protein/permease [Clostridia bacterium]
MHYEEQEYSKRIDLNTVKKLAVFAKPYKKGIILLIVQMLFLALVDTLFTNLTRFAIDNFVVTKSLTNFVPFCLFVAFMVLFQGSNVWLMIKNAGTIEHSIPYDMRKAAFKKLQELPISYYDRTPVGWLMARMTSDIRRIGVTLSWHVVDFFWSIFLVVLMTIFMLLTNVKYALLVLSVVPFLVIISMIFQKKILHNFRKTRKYNSQITAAFNEGITGAKTIKSLSAEDHMLEEFEKVTEDMRNFSIRAATISSIYTPLILLLGSIATGLVLWTGGYEVRAYTASYGTLVLFISYAVQFFEPVKQFARVFTELQYTQASAERVVTLLETENDIQDNEKVTAHFGEMLDSNREAWPSFTGNVEFKDVTFRYKEGGNILENFNLSIKAGEKVALVGETGSGKTTIINLACRFYEPTEGSILVDGVDYRERPLLWMYSNIGYVLQEPHLFSGTVRENIAYGRQDATNEDIEQAAKIVNAHDFIMNLEKGYDTEVGERGSRLSTGQKQLVSFARAILSNPGMFVLDEATSSVDTETEHLIQDALNRALEGRTSFIIAHRLSTIRSADRILVIDKGRIIEEGTHKKLIRKKGYYYRLYTNQLIEEQERAAYAQ